MGFVKVSLIEWHLVCACLSGYLRTTVLCFDLSFIYIYVFVLKKCRMKIKDKVCLGKSAFFPQFMKYVNLNRVYSSCFLTLTLKNVSL